MMLLGLYRGYAHSFWKRFYWGVVMLRARIYLFSSAYTVIEYAPAFYSLSILRLIDLSPRQNDGLCSTMMIPARKCAEVISAARFAARP